MLDLATLATVLRETFTVGCTPRVPEPEMAMDLPEQVESYARAGRNDGMMAQTFLFNCAHICDILRPGDLAVDLGCGPATQLATVARYQPQVRFLGIDLSDDMLKQARFELEDHGLRNVELRKGDITTLDFLSDHSVDAVFSTFSLHHLPTIGHLEQACSEVDRVLKPGGGLYLFDLGHLKSERSIQFFTHRSAEVQDDVFTKDYHNSLRAAFYADEFRRMTTEHFSQRAKLYAQFPMPLLMAIKSPCRACHEPDLSQRIQSHRQSLPTKAQRDLRNLLIRPFRFGGLHTSLLD